MSEAYAQDADLVMLRGEQLRHDPAYQARVDKVLSDAERGILPPLIPVDYLMAAGSHLDQPSGR